MSSKSGSTTSPLPSSPVLKRSPSSEKESSAEAVVKSEERTGECIKGESVEVCERDDIEEVKPKGRSMFSIQSILARPEPRRAAVERTFHYPHLFQPNLAAFFPQKYIPGHSFFPLWPGQLINGTEFPGKKKPDNYMKKNCFSC